MALTDYLLYRCAKNWPSPVAWRESQYGAQQGTDAYGMAYAWAQFNAHVTKGIAVPPRDLEVLEIGCGHGGICCFLAAAGAKRVVGIDLNTKNMEYAERLAAEISRRYGPDATLPVEFLEMNAFQMNFPTDTFDLVVAENAFEHFTEPETVLRESFRVLRPGGRLLAPLFGSRFNKYALHLKHSLRVPWPQLFFSERTIIRAMQRLAVDDPSLHVSYPGLKSDPQRVRDLRKYKDLNDLTYKKFKRIAGEVGFELEWLRPSATRIGKLIARMPFVRNTWLMDVFSMGASALLRKPKRAATSAEPTPDSLAVSR